MIDNTTVQVTAGITILVVVGTGLALGTARQGPSDDLAAAGSPLYTRVVHESIRTLDQQPGGPGDAKSDVCPDCGQVHAPAVAAGEVCPDCGQVHSQVAPAEAGSVHNHVAGRQPVSAPALQPAVPGAANRAIPPGVPPNSYYCPDCKTYHARPVAGQTPVLNPHTPPLQLAPSP